MGWGEKERKSDRLKEANNKNDGLMG